MSIDSKLTEDCFVPPPDDAVMLACEAVDESRSTTLEEAWGGGWGAAEPHIDAPLSLEGEGPSSGISAAPPPASPPPPTRKHQDWPRGRLPRRSLRSTSPIDARESEQRAERV